MLYIDIKKEKPIPGRTIDYIDSNGYAGTGIYLCKCCQSEWRCDITGGGMMVDVDRWRYKNTFEEGGII